MKISKNKVVTLEYILKDDKGHTIETSDKNGPIIYLHVIYFISSLVK